jgi:hypothetical protein
LVFWNRATGNYFDFIGNNEPNVGHLDGLLSTSNAIFIADISSNGDLFSSTGTGAGIVYEIQVVPPAHPVHGVPGSHSELSRSVRIPERLRPTARRDGQHRPLSKSASGEPLLARTAGRGTMRRWNG